MTLITTGSVPGKFVWMHLFGVKRQWRCPNEAIDCENERFRV